MILTALEMAMAKMMKIVMETDMEMEMGGMAGWGGRELGDCEGEIDVGGEV